MLLLCLLQPMLVRSWVLGGDTCVQYQCKRQFYNIFPSSRRILSLPVPKDAIISADEHCAQQLDEYNISDEGDRDFVSEIFHGIIRYQKLLKVRRVVVCVRPPPWTLSSTHRLFSLGIRVCVCYMLRVRCSEQSLTWQRQALFGGKGDDKKKISETCHSLSNKRAPVATLVLCLSVALLRSSPLPPAPPIKTTTQVLTDGFYAEEKGINTPKDHPLFEVTLYLTLMLFSDLGGEAVEQMLRSLSRVEMRKVLHILRFTWDVDNMRTWIKDEWTLLYDRHYVHDRLMQPAEDNWAEMQDILDRMDKSVVGKLPPRQVT